MDLRKLHIFNTVASTGSFTLAAQKLHMAQPAVSIAVRKLEEELELLLFHRQDKRIHLTTEGEALLRHSDSILESVRLAQVEMNELKGLLKGEVRVGIPNTLGSYYFPETLMAFKSRYPDLKLTVIEGGAREIQQQVNKGTLDIGILVLDHVPETLETQFLFREEMVVAVSVDHPFAKLKSIELSDFFAEDLVLYKAGFFHREYVDRLSQEAGLPIKLGFETNLITLNSTIVKKGFGITNFLRGVVEQDAELAAVSFAKPAWLEFCIAWKRDGYLSHAERQFVGFLLEEAARNDSTH